MSIEHDALKPAPVPPAIDPPTFSLFDTAPTKLAPSGPPTPALAAGDTLGRYVLVRQLGGGGMGLVWEALDPGVPRAVAVKVMRPELAGDPTIRERFVREARAQAAVQHPRVVPLFAVGEDGPVPYFVMPLLDGEPLSAVLRRGRLPLADVLRVGREVAEGLQAAHDRGLIHRDVKPGNVWLNAPHGNVSLLDFGIARVPDLGPAGDPITSTGMVVGTPAYMAPEQAAGKRVDARADLFSLGVLLYELSTGVHPFRHESLYTTLTALANTDPPLPNAVWPDVPPVLADLIDRLLAKDPAGRWPATAGEVAAILGRLESADAAVTLPPRPRKGRRRWRWVALLLPLTVLLPAASFFVWRAGTPPPPPPVVPAPPTVEDRLQQFAARLREQKLDHTCVDVTRNGLFGNERKNTHRFEGTTGAPVLSEVTAGQATVRIPYEGVYDRVSVEFGFYTTPETKSARGVVTVSLAAAAAGVRVTGYEHTEADGQVTDRGHNAQKCARAAVEALVDRAAGGRRVDRPPAHASDR